MSRVRLAALGIAVMAALAGCGGGDGESTPTSVVSVPETTEADTSSPPEVTTSEAPVEADSEFATGIGLEPIVLLTPEAGGGDRPDLEWQPVDGAVTYQITVRAPDGSVYWGRMGPETSVPFGGFPRLVPEAAGPRIVAGMDWTVIAFDASMVPIGAGGPRSLSP
jgi:hypothetical protein